MPENCVAQQSCEAIVTAVFVNNSLEFELKSNASRFREENCFKTCTGVMVD